MEMDDMALHETKAEIFDTWTVINRAFEQIISGLEKLQKMGVLSDDYVTDQDTIANDLWAKINSVSGKRMTATITGRCVPR
jgi:hypothetical protein